MRGEIYGLKTPQAESAAEKFSVKPLISREEFVENVKKAKEYIYNGDIFQAVLSQRFEISNPPDAFKVYRALRADEPSPYMYTMCFEDCEIVGSSPEKLISVENGLVTSCPIAGTIKRGKSEAEDKALENKLLSNEKERAEHIMLVDLARNDIGKICEFGTVNVDKLMQIGRFSKLMHIISQVTGNLKSEYSLTDVLASSLPAGTLSGAPKVRAMQIIDELETQKRGLYGGSIGYMGFNGIMDMCIAIRTAFFSGGKAYVQAGAGIVADSVPEAEYEEVLTKTSAVLNAFEKAGELL
jgi:anthranilate synthase component 1